MDTSPEKIQEANDYFYGKRPVETSAASPEEHFVIPEDPKVIKKQITLLNKKIARDFENQKKEKVARYLGIVDTLSEKASIINADVTLQNDQNKLSQLQKALGEKRLKKKNPLASFFGF